MTKNNLIPNSKRTPSELRKITKKGGIKSGESRRKKKLLKEVILDLLYSKSKTDKTKTNQELMVVSLFEKALTGDAKAFEVLRDTSGQKPVDKQETNIKGNITTNDLSRLGTETLLKMAEKAEVDIVEE